MALLYFKIDPGKFIQFDDVTNRAQILVKAELQDEKRDLITRIGTPDPGLPQTNADWIAWAKSHYPYVDHSAEQRRLDEVNAILDAIKLV